MCRLMAFSARTETTLPSFMGSAFQEFVELSKVHDDSWGLALSNGSTATVTKKAETAALSSSFQETVQSANSYGGLLHFRWASPIRLLIKILPSFTMELSAPTMPLNLWSRQNLQSYNKARPTVNSSSFICSLKLSALDLLMA
jgi:predicted glutamine amidotransferase